LAGELGGRLDQSAEDPAFQFAQVAGPLAAVGVLEFAEPALVGLEDLLDDDLGVAALVDALGQLPPEDGVPEKEPLASWRATASMASWSR